jgi:hypothetical protein
LPEGKRVLSGEPLQIEADDGAVCHDRDGPARIGRQHVVDRRLKAIGGLLGCLATDDELVRVVKESSERRLVLGIVEVGEAGALILLQIRPLKTRDAERSRDDLARFGRLRLDTRPA